MQRLIQRSRRDTTNLANLGNAVRPCVMADDGLDKYRKEYNKMLLEKRVRKYGAYCTGITQNVDDLLQSHTTRTMFANSEFIIMLNQASTDRKLMTTKFGEV